MEINELLNHLVAVEKELARYNEVEKQIKKLETQKKQLKDAMFQLLPNADFTTIVDDYKVKALVYEVATFDKTKFQHDQPALYDQYKTTSTSLRLTIAPVVKEKEAS